MSQAHEQLVALGGEMVSYTPYQKAARPVLALIDPIRRTDALGNQSFLTKTYEVLIVKSATEGIVGVKENYDVLEFFLSKDDDVPTRLRITKILPHRDDGIPGDGVGMWHLEGAL
jgi:hypothetical protein